MNPYSVSSRAPLRKGYFGDHALLVDGTFLYRTIQIRHPIETEMVYSGWWFRQTLDFDGLRVWSQISWLSIRRDIEFQLPEDIDPLCRRGRIKIDFGRGLRISRYQVWIDDETVYDECSY